MIRQAQSTDYASLVQLREAATLDVLHLEKVTYRVAIQKKGFLAPRDNPVLHTPKDDYPQSDFVRDLSKIFLVYIHNDKIHGYIRIDETHGLDSHDEADWYRQEMAKVYFDKPHAQIGGICVSTQEQSKHIGSQLLETVIQKLQNKNIQYLYSFVIVSPITNIPSLLFHEKHDFQRLAIVKPCRDYGMDNFQSTLYGKRLLSTRLQRNRVGIL